ncbi:hypothetical protein [Clostridium sp. C8-1-8]|uniref:hypothetical protein n=1 Tax=Clostridium sp. C8-1-8 TaxID=2698831 RepID=UPI0013713FF2|nr:hypothetical protein [Clostridium sp. C8-1-8]
MGLGYNDENYVKKFMEGLRQYKGNARENPMKAKDYLEEWIPIILSALVIYTNIYIADYKKSYSW